MTASCGRACRTNSPSLCGGGFVRLSFLHHFLEHYSARAPIAFFIAVQSACHATHCP